MSKKRDPRIIELEKPYIERERKFVPIVPDAVARKGEDAIAAYKSRKLLMIAEHVRLSVDTFVTADHPSLAPIIPEALAARKFTAEDERTKPRERIYYLDVDMKVRDLSVEFRQETHKRNGVKQTIKITRDSGKDSPTLNREEIHAKLTGPGVVLTAVDEEKRRRWLTRNFKEAALKPGFRMVSQRIRIPYFPEGNTDVMIELACDYILFGETIFGKVWQDPKLEIEIIKGPADEEACRRILEREEQRIMEEFDMVAQLESNAEIGYRHMADDLATKEGRAKLNALGPREVWWDKAGRAKWGLK
ncbi:MAG: hypothetical protein KKA05_00740 [Alphaproteobacteria bacterium]|nr:hypothetical protein [Alphaproteobacteria bacterium]